MNEDAVKQFSLNLPYDVWTAVKTASDKEGIAYTAYIIRALERELRLKGHAVSRHA